MELEKIINELEAIERDTYEKYIRDHGTFTVLHPRAKDRL